MNKIKYIAFDMDNTLFDKNFDNYIWNEEIPRLYAKKNNISLEEGKRHVYAEYYIREWIKPVDDWTNIENWFEIFGLEFDLSVLDDLKKNTKIYPDTKETIEYLSKKYKLIVLSNANINFINVKMTIDGLEKYFEKIYSVPFHFSYPRKNEKTYRQLLENLMISNKEIIQVGDTYRDDYLIPRQVGIESYLIDRNERYKKEKNILRSLLELKKLY